MVPANTLDHNRFQFLLRHVSMESYMTSRKGVFPFVFITLHHDCEVQTGIPEVFRDTRSKSFRFAMNSV
jgi:hypothetical protein